MISEELVSEFKEVFDKFVRTFGMENCKAIMENEIKKEEERNND